MTKRFAVALSSILLLVIALPRADVIEQVLVRINGDILTKTEFEQRQVAALRQRPDIANIPLDSPELRKAIAEITPQLVLDAVDELLMVQRGRELGYTLGDEQFNGILANIKKQNNLEDDARFQAALKSENMTLADLRKNLERQMLVSRVQQTEVMGKISVTDEEVAAYYDQHKGEFSTTPQVTLREILVTVPGTEGSVNVAADEAARDKA